MKKLHAIIRVLEDNRDMFFELVRIYLGVALFVRGMVFFTYEGDATFIDLVAANGWLSHAFLAHYIIIAHLAGGLLLAVGLLTRLAALIQIPILFVAVFFVHFDEGLFAAGQNLELAALVLFLLVLVFLHGARRLSVDAAMQDRRVEKEPTKQGKSAVEIEA
ncbi:MAG: DoxX family protein [Opitutales bacterium]